ncbi:MAG: ZIP family metal transporter [Candidatus Micrarchaeota archaeon]|nr:ZIP family metal transporter [Candidatus Micrarchaeota archaeon]
MDFLGLLLGAGLAFAATSLGAAGVIFFKKFGCEKHAAILAFCAGVMAFSAFEMFIQSREQLGLLDSFGALAVGMGLFLVIEKTLPHAHMLLRKRELAQSKKKAALVAGTITLHNVPEGFAIASAFASSSPLGWLVSVSIALQDAPEGMVVAAPLACYGMETKRAFMFGAFSGFVEFAAAIVGFLFLSAIDYLTPLSLAFSAGAMLYVVFFELLSDALTGKQRLWAMAAFVSGIVAAMLLAAAFSL